jgi:hypothetical protein
MVDTSSVSSQAILRSNRRIILPERVFGNAAVISTSSGTANAPTNVRTVNYYIPINHFNILYSGSEYL